MNGWPLPEAAVSALLFVPETSWQVPGAVPSYAFWPLACQFHAVQVDCAAHRQLLESHSA